MLQYYDRRNEMKRAISRYLFSVIFVELSLAAIATPQTKDFSLWTVGHVDNSFEPPALNDRPADSSQNQPVLPHFQEAQVTTGVSSQLDGETVPVHLP